MVFYFLGVFATPSETTVQTFTDAWPDADVIEMTIPFEAMAARLPERLYDEDLEIVPVQVIDTVQAISRAQPDAQFLVLCTACAVQCWDCGHIIQRGDVVASFEGEGALRQLVRFFGVDLGDCEYFAPLTRDFPWTKLQA